MVNEGILWMFFCLLPCILVLLTFFLGSGRETYCRIFSFVFVFVFVFEVGWRVKRRKRANLDKSSI